MTDRLEPDAAREILRRAVELEAAGDAPGIDIARESLEAAAAEVGISAEAVRRAVAEHGVGAIPAVPRQRSVLGPCDVTVMATVDLPPATVEERVSRFLRSQLLTVARRLPNGAEWRRRDDLGARIRRRVDFNKRIRLDGVDRVVAAVGDAGEDRSVVRIEVDFENTRRGLRTGTAGATLGLPVAGGVAALFTGEAWLFAAGFPAAAAIGSAGLVLSRKLLASQVDEAQRVVELFLSELG